MRKAPTGTHIRTASSSGQKHRGNNHYGCGNPKDIYISLSNSLSKKIGPLCMIAKQNHPPFICIQSNIESTLFIDESFPFWRWKTLPFLNIFPKRCISRPRRRWILRSLTIYSVGCFDLFCALFSLFQE